MINLIIKEVILLLVDANPVSNCWKAITVETQYNEEHITKPTKTSGRGTSAHKQTDLELRNRNKNT